MLYLSWRYQAMSSVGQNVGYRYRRRHDHRQYGRYPQSAMPYESSNRRNVPSRPATTLGYWSLTLSDRVLALLHQAFSALRDS
ncbi:Uncharacterised protein [Vibrio cholerae]|nr:Uncharacterised protein [Vibrio cholerae]